MTKLFLIGLALLFSIDAAATTTGASSGMDFTNVTSAVDASTIVAAITAIAAIKILPGVAKWGYNKVIGWFR